MGKARGHRVFSGVVPAGQLASRPELKGRRGAEDTARLTETLSELLPATQQDVTRGPTRPEARAQGAGQCHPKRPVWAMQQHGGGQSPGLQRQLEVLLRAPGMKGQEECRWVVFIRREVKPGISPVGFRVSEGSQGPLTAQGPPAPRLQPTFSASLPETLFFSKT